MTYLGHVENGVVILDQPIDLPEGTRVRVELTPVTPAKSTLGQRLLDFAGKAQDLPPDAARNVDRYLYGPSGS